MKAAPGAQLSIEDIFGRDELVAYIWRILETNSVRLEAERRIGKTHILNKMEAQSPPEWEAIKVNIEEVHSAAEFAEKVCRAVHHRLVGWKKQGLRLKTLLGVLDGIEAGPIKFPEKKDQGKNYWKQLLCTAIEDLVEQQAHAGKRVVFLFDEMPWMLGAIAKSEGEQTAMEILDVLRSLRQSTTTGPGFRMVLCGSIGLHHVLKDFKKHGYRNEPVNDMMLIEVTPLDIPVAVELAALLLAGSGLTADAVAAKLIANQTGGFPYYIHWVVSKLQFGRNIISPAEIEHVILTLLTETHDPCNFRHFRGRINDYYPGEEKYVLAILDHAAAAKKPIDQAELINVAKSAGITDADRVRELLCLLAVDHYLSRNTEGRYTFRHVLLRRWWILERGLSQ